MQLPILSQKSLKTKSLALPSLSAKETSGGYLKPSDWPDIRSAALSNSIYLLAAHSADFTSYNNLGFKATVTGGYNVFIDGVQYGSTYASGAQCSITWSTAGITTGYDITTPVSLRAHIIHILPATEGNNITAYQGQRVATSGTETQGIVWLHFNLDTSIDVASATFVSGYYRNALLTAVTAKNNTLKTSRSENCFAYSSYLSFLSTFDYQQNAYSNALRAFLTMYAFYNTNLKQITLKNTSEYTSSMELFCNGYSSLKSVSVINGTLKPTDLRAAFRYCNSLLKLPDIDYSNCTLAADFLTEAVNLQDTVIDMRAATALTAVGAYGTATYPMRGLKGLRVSSSAPFTYATAPQINIAYTGLTREALLTLFGDLPTVSAEQIVYIVGASGAADLTAEDIAIATAKGWTVTR